MGEQLPGLSSSYMSHQSKDKKYLFQRRCWLCCQVITVLAILLIVWGALSLPIVLYNTSTKSEPDLEVPTSAVKSIINNSRQDIDNSSNSKFKPVRTINKTESETVKDCNEGFYRKNNTGICFPDCYTWSNLGKNDLLIRRICTTTAVIIATMGSVLYLISVCIQRKTLFRFPSVLLVYFNLDLLLFEIIYLVGYTDRRLYCSSQNLLDSLQIVTPFCVVAGIAYNYFFLQFPLWTLFYIMIFSWSLYFPYQYRSIQKLRKMKYVHLVCVTIGIIIPLTPVVTQMGIFATSGISPGSNITFWRGGAGFMPTGFPATDCAGANAEAIFYTLPLMWEIIVIIYCTCLVLIIWRICQKKMRCFGGETFKPFKFGAAEIKLLILFFYYTIVYTCVTVFFTLIIRNFEERAKVIQDIFLCEQGGYDPENPCDRTKLEALAYPKYLPAQFLLLSLLPIIHLMLFGVNTKTFQKCCKKCWSTVTSSKSKTDEVEMS